MIKIRKRHNSRFLLKARHVKFLAAVSTLLLCIIHVRFIQNYYVSTPKQVENYSQRATKKKKKYVPCSAEIPKGKESQLNPVKDYISSEKRDFRGKAFESYSFSCFPGYSNFGKDGPDLRGLIYTRIHKASSSTLSGVNIRIATRQNEERCASTWNHVTAHDMNITHRDKASTFLWTFIRHPTKRFISHHFYFVVSRRGISADDRNLCAAIRRPFTSSNYQLRYAHPDKISIKIDLADPSGIIKNATDQVQKVFQEYNFIGITERFDESIVALQLLLGLDVGDILYISSNVQGSYDRIKDQEGLRCVKMQKSNVSQKMEEYFTSKKWYDVNAGDFLLHDTANRSLDMTIKRIGKTKFDAALSTFLKLKSRAKKCELTVRYPCENGILRSNFTNNCYLDDFGCGYSCLDEISDL